LWCQYKAIHRDGLPLYRHTKIYPSRKDKGRWIKILLKARIVPLLVILRLGWRIRASNLKKHGSSDRIGRWQKWFASISCHGPARLRECRLQRDHPYFHFLRE
jgi:hypothetical protein